MCAVHSCPSPLNEFRRHGVIPCSRTQLDLEFALICEWTLVLLSCNVKLIYLTVE